MDTTTLTEKLLPLSIEEIPTEVTPDDTKDVTVDSALDDTLANTLKNNTSDLDPSLVTMTTTALGAGRMAQLGLKDLIEQGSMKSLLPVVKKQILNVETAFTAAEAEFTEIARRLLPELRDGATNQSPQVSELLAAVALFEQRTRLTEDFTTKKLKEAHVFHATVSPLLDDGFENHLGGLTARPPADTELPRLLLSLGGASIGHAHHPLQAKIESSKVGVINESHSDDSDEDDDDEEEWFENQQTVSNVKDSCTELRRQRKLALQGVTFGVTSVNKAYRPGGEKRTKTSVGDIVLDYKGKLLIVTGMIPIPPRAPSLTIKDQTITVTWSQDRSEYEELAIPTTAFVARFRPRPNPVEDGAFPRASGNEAFGEIHCKASETDMTINMGTSGARLADDCDYEVQLSIETILGQSGWSKPVVGRTAKVSSVASKMIDFYLNNRTTLSHSKQRVKPWELYDASGKTTLFLGLTDQDQRKCTDSRFDNQLAVRIVDVAAEFEPEIVPASIQDRDNTIVAVFAGCSGHGKSTQINAFVSFLLGGDVRDSARIMVIDDRGANQAYSVTQCVTCYRIRPLSALFKGKTLLIVDTPGYGDTRGVERDAFVTAAMSEFFKTVEHVNAVIFTCRANESRTTTLSPVSTYVFSLFAKDVGGCLRTIYTFSDAGSPLARTALKELSWPVHNGEVEVNNAAFTVELDANNESKVRDWWLMSMRGQFQVIQMLLLRPPVPTAKSAAVTEKRLELERRCELVEKKILRTANEAQLLIANLGALANAVGAAPGDKILVNEDKAVMKDLPEGEATTLCIDCNRTCHEICVYGDDEDKRKCVAISGNHCTICKGRCHWTSHKNAKYIIGVEQVSQWVVPDDLIKRWNSNNNSLEGALLNAIDAYLELQKDLRKDILHLARLTDELMNTALLHDPVALITYVETLIKTARARGSPAEQIVQLTTAKNTLLLVREIKIQGTQAIRDSQVLHQVMGRVRKEMNRRMSLEPRQRAEAEKDTCSLYNSLYEELPPEIQERAPGRLKEASTSFFSGTFLGKLTTRPGALYPENLQAIVKLVQVVLSDGGVVAAIVTSRS